MKKETYRVTHPDFWDWECNVVIDHGFKDIEEIIKVQVEFWGQWESKLRMNDGDYIKTYLQMIASKALMHVLEGYNLYGVISEFDGSEGWCKLDGSNGIEITSVDSYEFPDSEFEVHKN